MPKNLLPANFRIEINGIPSGYFTEIAGIGSEHDGAGHTKWGDITLKKGYIATDPLSHKISPASVAHKINPAMHKVNPGSLEHKISPAMHKINPGSMAHKINPAMHKVNSGALEHKINPAMHKVNPASLEHKVNPAMHKVNPASLEHKVNPAMQKVNPVMHKANPGLNLEMRSAGRLLLRGFVLDETNKQLQHWVNPGAAKTPTPQGHIVMLDENGRPVRRWQFFEAWPCKWNAPDADGSSTVEIAVSKLVRV